LIDLQALTGILPHLERGDGSLLPVWQRWFKSHGVVLQHPETERADGIVCFEASAILCRGSDTILRVSDVTDDGVQQEPIVSSTVVVLSAIEELGCLAFDDGIETTVVKDIVVFIAPLTK
jgi:hypothetical protein